jgi:uncharacterized membrane protein YgcG
MLLPPPLSPPLPLPATGQPNRRDDDDDDLESASALVSLERERENSDDDGGGDGDNPAALAAISLGSPALSSALRSVVFIYSLRLSHNRLTDAAAVLLARALTPAPIPGAPSPPEDQNFANENDDANQMQPGAGGAAAVSVSAVQSQWQRHLWLPCLHSLFLDHNFISDDGAAAFAAALKAQMALLQHTLDRDHEQHHQQHQYIEHEAGVAVRWEHGGPLRILVLHDNLVGDAGATRLVEALKTDCQQQQQRAQQLVENGGHSYGGGGGGGGSGGGGGAGGHTWPRGENESGVRLTVNLLGNALSGPVAALVSEIQVKC